MERNVFDNYIYKMHTSSSDVKSNHYSMTHKNVQNHHPVVYSSVERLLAMKDYFYSTINWIYHKRTTENMLKILKHQKSSLK